MQMFTWTWRCQTSQPLPSSSSQQLIPARRGPYLPRQSAGEAPRLRPQRPTRSRSVCKCAPQVSAECRQSANSPALHDRATKPTASSSKRSAMPRHCHRRGAYSMLRPLPTLHSRLQVMKVQTVRSCAHSRPPSASELSRWGAMPNSTTKQSPDCCMDPCSPSSTSTGLFRSRFTCSARSAQGHVCDSNLASSLH